jgi:signal transduction histidine kinase
MCTASNQALALAVYLATAVAVSVVVGLAARRHDEAVRAGAEAAELSALAGSGAGSQQSLPEVLSRVRNVFGVEYAAVVEPAGAGSRVVAESGTARSDGVEIRVEVSGKRALLVCGRALSTDDRRVLTAFARAAVASLERQELAEQAAQAARLATIDQLRTTLIAGVGHDLRTPLAGIKAAVTSLRADDVDWSAAERTELLSAVESSADRLDALVANLLASSRLDVGALSVELAPVDVEEVIGRGLAGVGQLHRVVVDVPDGCRSCSPTSGWQSVWWRISSTTRCGTAGAA